MKSKQLKGRNMESDDSSRMKRTLQNSKSEKKLSIYDSYREDEDEDEEFDDSFDDEDEISREFDDLIIDDDEFFDNNESGYSIDNY